MRSKSLRAKDLPQAQVGTRTENRLRRTEKRTRDHGQGLALSLWSQRWPAPLDRRPCRHRLPRGRHEASLPHHPHVIRSRQPHAGMWWSVTPALPRVLNSQGRLDTRCQTPGLTVWRETQFKLWTMVSALIPAGVAFVVYAVLAQAVNTLG